MSAQLTLLDADATVRPPPSLDLPLDTPARDDLVEALQRDLVAALQAAGLAARLHIDEPAGDRAIFVKFGRDHVDRDRALLDNVLARASWTPDHRTSREMQALVHVLHLRHRDGARIALIVSTAHSAPTTKGTPR